MLAFLNTIFASPVAGSAHMDVVANQFANQFASQIGELCIAIDDLDDEIIAANHEVAALRTDLEAAIAERDALIERRRQKINEALALTDNLKALLGRSATA